MLNMELRNWAIWFNLLQVSGLMGNNDFWIADQELKIRILSLWSTVHNQVLLWLL